MNFKIERLCLGWDAVHGKQKLWLPDNAQVITIKESETPTYFYLYYMIEEEE